MANNSRYYVYFKMLLKVLKFSSVNGKEITPYYLTIQQDVANEGRVNTTVSMEQSGFPLLSSYKSLVNEPFEVLLVQVVGYNQMGCYLREDDTEQVFSGISEVPCARGSTPEV